MSLMLATAAQVKAQEFKTDESIGSQLKNGTAPGLKFGPAASRSTRVAKTTTDPNEGKESQASQIKNGTLKGMKYAGGGGLRTTQRAARPAARVQTVGNLPSDEKASVQKPITVVKPVLVPTQDGAVENKDGKPALPAKPILQSKKQD